MHYIGIIPARYASSRFPGKPLCRIGGKTMIERVCIQARKVKELERVIVATDHPEIEACVKAFGGEVCMTSALHRSGTDRCAEVFRTLMPAFAPEESVVVNIQGDEPFIRPLQIAEVIACMEDGAAHIATLLQRISDREALADPNVVKCVRGMDGTALYFSRHPIPYLRSMKFEEHCFYKHIGLYAYRADTLLELVQLPLSSLEGAESLEQLRWLENGYRMATRVTACAATLSIDTPADLEKALKYEQSIADES
ncbi:MAG: 3-deoxy-manno-octulosonate cytidylyltransferase [Bacteroidales bacterium]|nr:3-deoxy-manno-octulosonate cytidylyltransferase [Bacteroidales bacterium]